MDHEKSGRAALIKARAVELTKLHRAYRLWLQTDEARALKYHKPAEYGSLRNNPNHFAETRKHFNVYWITQKMLS